jgi:hypothetical protein
MSNANPTKNVVNPSVTHTIRSGKSLVVIEERKYFTQRATDPLSFEKLIFRNDQPV